MNLYSYNRLMRIQTFMANRIGISVCRSLNQPMTDCQYRFTLWVEIIITVYQQIQIRLSCMHKLDFFTTEIRILL